MNDRPPRSPAPDAEPDSAVTEPPKAAPGHTNPLQRFLVETGPLGAFFVAYVGWNLMTATAVLMVTICISLIFSIKVEKRVPAMPLVTAVVVLIFGGLTLYLNNDVFIKMKPTIVNCLFALALFGGLAFGRPLLKPLFGPVFQLEQAGWMKLSFRWACFFLVLAGINEVVWRTTSTDFWVSFKVFGLLPLTLVFAAVQVGLLQKHAPGPD